MPKIVDHEQQRLDLSATVADVVAARGLEETTLRTVAAEHGCTKGMVQHYFSDKEQLLQAALAYVEGRFSSATEAAGEGLSGLELARAGLEVQLPLSHDLRRDWQVRLAFQTRGRHLGELAAILAAYREALDKRLAGALRQAEREGELSDALSRKNSCRLLVATLWGIGIGALGQGMPPAAQRQLLGAAIDSLRR